MALETQREAVIYCNGRSSPGLGLHNIMHDGKMSAIFMQTIAQDIGRYRYTVKLPEGYFNHPVRGIILEGRPNVPATRSRCSGCRAHTFITVSPVHCARVGPKIIHSSLCDKVVVSRIDVERSGTACIWPYYAQDQSPVLLSSVDTRTLGMHYAHTRTAVVMTRIGPCPGTRYIVSGGIDIYSLRYLTRTASGQHLLRLNKP
ncbi:hypothetical protein C8Q77DRAFT_1115835 [Trametes polyzona]|nr:hypothetical protein C8Q77DRAFT_1115835 [Trametes polyzona]